MRSIQAALESAYNKEFSSDDLVRQLIAAVEDGDPAVWEMYAVIKGKQAEMETEMEKIKYKRNSE